MQKSKKHNNQNHQPVKQKVNQMERPAKNVSEKKELQRQRTMIYVHTGEFWALVDDISLFIHILMPFLFNRKGISRV
jgi:hypothetical protein